MDAWLGVYSVLGGVWGLIGAFMQTRYHGGGAFFIFAALVVNGLLWPLSMLWILVHGVNTRDAWHCGKQCPHIEPDPFATTKFVRKQPRLNSEALERKRGRETLRGYRRRKRMAEKTTTVIQSPGRLTPNRVASELFPDDNQ